MARSANFPIPPPPPRFGARTNYSTDVEEVNPQLSVFHGSLEHGVSASGAAQLYDITDTVRVDAGGTNVLGSKYRSYLGQSLFNRDYRYDDSIYIVGMRVRFQ